jgi:hypothetical protein
MPTSPLRFKAPEHYLLMFKNPPFCQTTWVKRIPHLRFLLAAIQRGFHEGVFKPRERYSQMEMAYAAWTVAHGIMLRPTYLNNLPVDFDTADTETLRTCQWANGRLIFVTYRTPFGL